MQCHRRNPGKSQSRLPPPFSRTPCKYFRFNKMVYRTDPIFHSYFQWWLVHVPLFDCSTSREDCIYFHSHTHTQLRSRPKHLPTRQLPSADTKTKPYADILGGLPETDNQLLACYLAPVGNLVALSLLNIFKSTGNGT